MKMKGTRWPKCSDSEDGPCHISEAMNLITISFTMLNQEQLESLQVREETTTGNKRRTRPVYK